jgi:hypothetical protein
VKPNSDQGQKFFQIFVDRPRVVAVSLEQLKLSFEHAWTRGRD